MKQKLVLVVTLLIVIALVLFLMMNGDSKVSPVEVKDGSLKISGSFGVTVPVSEITALEMKDTLPAISRKTNGSGLGKVFKGEFTLAGDIKSRLYVDASKPPFVSFMQGGLVFYVNCDTPEKTQALYDQLKPLVK